jgi:4-hydroxy-3-methylbut-2-enyl diphosphate reductase
MTNVAAKWQGFDPEKDLVRVGLANQTTMLRNETMEIGKMLERAMLQKYGPAELKDHYMVLDTICDATQALSLSLHARSDPC